MLDPNEGKATEELESSATDEQGSEPIADEETSEASDESSTPEKTDEEANDSDEAEEESELKSILKESKTKDQNNVQKRIDQLTAQLKELKAENQKLSSGKPESKEPEYSDAQLKSAMQKAFEEGDHALAWDIIDYKTKQMEKSLVSRYEAEKRAAEQQYSAVNKEWQKVTMDYSRVWEDDKGRELYPGAKKDLDITSEKSLLYQLAAELYQSTDEDGSRPYATMGGQKAAVADALSSILRRKKISPVDSDKRKLERSLAKAKRKNSLSGGGSSDDAPKRSVSSTDALNDYINERKNLLTKRMSR